MASAGSAAAADDEDWKLVVKEREKPKEKEESVANKWAKLLRKYWGRQKTPVDLPRVRCVPEYTGIQRV